MHSSRRKLAIAALAAFAWIALGTFGCGGSDEKSGPEVDSAIQAKYGPTRKEILFEITPDRPLLLRATAGLEEIRILSVVRVSGLAYGAEFLYGLRVKLVKGDEILWQNTFYEKTRRTYLVKSDGGVIQDMIDPSDEMAVTDRRTTDVFLGEAVAQADRVEIALVTPEDGTAFIRVYDKEVRSEKEVERNWRRMDDAARKKRLAVSALPPTMLESEQLLDLLSTVYLPIPPQGVSGEDYLGRPFFLREEPVTYRDYSYGNGEKQILVGGHRQLAVNSCGAGKIRFELGVDSESPVKSSQFSMIGEQTGPSNFDAQIQNEDRFRFSSIDLADQCSSTVLGLPTEEPTWVRIWYLEKGVQDHRSNWKELSPDYHSTRGYSSKPLIEGEGMLKPIRVALPEGQEYVAVRSFPILDSAPDKPFQYNYSYSFLGPDGQPVDEGRVESEATAAPLALFPPGGPLAEKIPGESATTYFAIPSSATGMEVFSKERVAFSFLTTYSHRGMREAQVPEDSASKIVNRCRTEYEPEWFGFRPLEHQELDAAGHGVTVMVQQVCLHVPEKTVWPSDTGGKSLVPKTYRAKTRMLEQAKRVQGNPDEATYRKIDPAGSQISIEKPAYGAEPADTDLYYRCPEGRPSLFVDDRHQENLVRAEGLARAIFAALEPGSRQIRLDGCENGAAFWRVDPKSNLKKPFKVRDYYRLDRGAEMIVPVRKPGSAAMFVNMITYRNGGSGRYVIEAKVSGGRIGKLGQEPPPYRNYRFDVSASGRKEAYCVQQTGCDPSPIQSYGVPLGVWYAPGNYELKLKLVQGEKALVRFFVMGQEKRKGPLAAFYRE
jgi:hypothetical protein